MADRKKHVQISFDDLNRIRILEADHFKQTEQLAEECTNFVEKIQVFTSTVNSLVEVLTTQSAKIEKEKMLAIGQRNKIESETETRKRKQQELMYAIAQKKQELQRSKDHFQSLEKIEMEQKVMIEKLTVA
mmetsp:Transcript_18134/g.25496  ORF Transcript_18134/g.25496 Transcript_18134/m.25496 type:complete len:131 (+) Transcript_18134:24-416(+)|eukprot:CAMPEP_0175097058 /NCGR_PEP_ID=MMETSP0086_2-20121207/5076_1 /TAXON_ID=136419 /ORGANISM="Unknown Unknown, Strain D1" /LENGTH=130 /DNA_ID=CAMNT_0016370527 /DNA_START=24 /DNA_END=416 /DNA_ORIENTATION=-